MVYTPKQSIKGDMIYSGEPNTPQMHRKNILYQSSIGTLTVHLESPCLSPVRHTFKAALSIYFFLTNFLLKLTIGRLIFPNDCSDVVVSKHCLFDLPNQSGTATLIQPVSLGESVRKRTEF